MEKAFLCAQDIAERYACGICRAYSIIRAIRDFNDGGALPIGKVLLSEVEYWEQNRGGRKDPTHEERT